MHSSFHNRKKDEQRIQQEAAIRLQEQERKEAEQRQREEAEYRESYETHAIDRMREEAEREQLEAQKKQVYIQHILYASCRFQWCSV